MQKVNTLINHGHLDAGSLGRCPNGAEIDVLTGDAAQLSGVAQMPLTAVQRVGDAQLALRALPRLTSVSVVRLQ